MLLDNYIDGDLKVHGLNYKPASLTACKVQYSHIIVALFKSQYETNTRIKCQC